MPDPAAGPSFSPLLVLALAALALIVLAGGWILYKSRPFADGAVFRASRLSRGNRLFPTQVQIGPSAVVHYTPQWIGHLEHTIHMAHVASVSIDTNMLFSDVYIETTGGTTPIHCRGHRKRDAIRMKALIEQFQTAYYRQDGPDDPGGTSRRGRALSTS
jgi:hypothetical protein